MPLNTAAVFRKPYRERPDADERELSATRLIQALLAAPDILPSHRREMLRIALYKYSEARAGKHGVRYRTAGVMDLDTPSMVEHEHVRSRQSIMAELLAGGPKVAPLILSTSVACLVTKEEHGRLSTVPKEIDGWARYAEAGLDVFDRKAGQWLAIDALEPGATAAEHPYLEQLLPGGPTRICLLTACRVSDARWSGAWSVLAGARDSESVEGRWMEQLLRSSGTQDDPSPTDVANAAATTAQVFHSRLLHEASHVLARVAAVAHDDVPSRASLSTELVHLAASDETRATPEAIPLIRAVLAASQEIDVPSWENVLRDTVGGRYAGCGETADTRSSLRAMAVKMSDPVLDLALILFEKRARAALSAPPAAVVEWIERRCGA